MSLQINQQEQIEAVKRRIADLLEELSVASEELGRINSGVERLRLQREITKIEHELDNEEKKLLKLEKPENTHRQNLDDLEENLHEIDFDAAKKITENLFKKYSNKEGAALLFLHNSQEMGGRWYIKFVKSQLRQLPLSSWAEPFEYRSEYPPAEIPRYSLTIYLKNSCLEWSA